MPSAIDGNASGLATEQLTSHSGAYAQLAGPPEEQKISVYNASQQLLFEYDPTSGKTRVSIPSGDLEVVAQRGDIQFTSGGDIRFQGQTIEMTSRWQLGMAVTDAIGHIVSSVTLGHRRAALRSPEIAVTAQRSELQIDETRYLGMTVTGNVRTTRLVAEKFETVATTVVQKTKNLFSTVEKLTQLQTGRLRTIVKGTSHFKSRKAYMRAQEDVKIQGKKIHLG